MSGGGVAGRIRILVGNVRVLAAAGIIGTSLMAVAAFRVGAVPAVLPRPTVHARHGSRYVFDYLPAPHDGAASALFGCGLVLLVGSWLLLGHVVFEASRTPSWRTVRRVGLLWSMPLLTSFPIGSRDLWAYAAQANLIVHGLNPYSVGPGALPGVFADQVSPQWSGTPSPYGPLWLTLARGVRELTASPLVAVFALRLLAWVGLLLLLWALPILAERFGSQPRVALWAVALNPLFLVHGVAGGHNDLLMIALVCLALVVATGDLADRNALLLAGTLLGAAGAIKVTALVAVAFLPLLRWRAHGTSRPTASRVVSALLLVGGAAAATLAAINLTSGLGVGWTAQAAGRSHTGDPARLLLMIAVLIVIWALALIWEPLAMLAAAFAAVVLITPIAEWWYWCWPIAIAAITLTRRTTGLILATASIALVTVVQPDGSAAHQRAEVQVCIALLACWCLLDQTWRPSRMRSLPPHRSESGHLAALSPPPNPPAARNPPHREHIP